MAYVAVTIPPASEPVTLDEAKAHLRVTTTSDDSYITSLIASARRWVEQYLAVSLITQTLELRLHRRDVPLGRELRLRKPPVQSVSSLTWYDEAGDSHAITGFSVSLGEVPPRLVVKQATDWGTNHRDLDAVIATYVAGYGDASDVPEPIKQAMLMLIADAYDVRSSVMISGDTIDKSNLRELLAPFRVYGAFVK